MSKVKTISVLLMVLCQSLGCIAASPAKQIACVWDVAGTSGDTYNMMRDYALSAKRWGANLELKPYTDERALADDMIAGHCDLGAMTGARARQFQMFIGSADAVGGISSSKETAALMNLLANPKLAAKMQSGDYEAVGISPMGSVFLLVNNRTINTLAKAAGKRFAVLEYEKAYLKMVQRIGGQAVLSEINNFATKFNTGLVDIIAAPALAFKPLELAKGLGSQGAIAQFPVTQTSLVLLSRKSRFPVGFGQQSREWINNRLPLALATAAKLEAGIPAKYWMPIPPADQASYIKIIRDARIDLTKEGIYNKEMLSLLKKIRCQANPTSFECGLGDE